MERSTPARIIKTAAVLVAAFYFASGNSLLHGETLHSEKSEEEIRNSALPAETAWRTGIILRTPEKTEPDDPLLLFIRNTLQNQFAEQLDVYTKNYLDQDEKEWMMRKHDLQKTYAVVKDLHQRKSEADEAFFFGRNEFSDADRNPAEADIRREDILQHTAEDDAFRQKLDAADHVPAEHMRLDETLPYGNAEKAVCLAAQYDLDEIISMELLELQGKGTYYFHMYGCRFTYTQDAPEERIRSIFKTYAAAEFSLQTVSSLRPIIGDVLSARFTENDKQHAENKLSSDPSQHEYGDNAEFISPTDSGFITGEFIGVYPPPEISISPAKPGYEFGKGESALIPDMQYNMQYDMRHDMEEVKFLLKRSGYDDYAVSLNGAQADTAVVFQPSWLSVLNSLDKRQSEFYRRLYTALESLAAASIVYGLHADKQTPQVTDLWDISLGFTVGASVLIAADAALQLAAYMRLNISDENMRH